MFKKAHIWVSLFILLASIWILIQDKGIKQICANLSFDTYQKNWPRRYTPVPVRIIDIDDESLARFGQWPWPRTQLAVLIDKLADAGASAIVFDIVFAEPDRTSPRALASIYPESPEVAALLGQLPDHDEVFAQKIQNGLVVLGFSCSSAQTAVSPPPQIARFITAGDDPRQFLHEFQGTVRNLEILEKSAAGIGAFNFLADRDGVIRHLPLLVNIRNRLFPGLAAEALRVAQGEKNMLIRASGASGEKRHGGHTGIVSVQIGAVNIPTDPKGEVWLHYSPSVPERYVSAGSILAGEFDPQTITGHILFIGTSAKGLLDLRYSPLQGLIPGVEMHAQLVEQVITGDFIRHPDWIDAATALFLCTMWLLLVLMTKRTRPVWLGIIALEVIGFTLGVSWFAFTEYKLFFDPLFPSMPLALMFIVNIFSRFLKTEKERRWIKKAFSSYISPNLVNHLMAHPEKLQLGGKMQECSFVMTDLANFTTFMENAEPVQVSQVLNTYIDEILKISFRHEGTLDRIIGDAVALIFSAPVEQEDHADRAVACALEIHRFSENFSREQKKNGIPLGHTRIGVHSGQVLVGNFGGSSIFDYRALGDPINTCARLEAVNKHLGTRICVSQNIRERCRNFSGRPVGTLILKGKTKGIDAYEPLSEAELNSPRVQAYLDAFEKLKAGSDLAHGMFMKLQSDYPDDPLIQFHSKRIMNNETGTVVIMAKK